jgi:hypothetical protein
MKKLTLCNRDVHCAGVVTKPLQEPARHLASSSISSEIGLVLIQSNLVLTAANFEKVFGNILVLANGKLHVFNQENKIKNTKHGGVPYNNASSFHS